MCKLHGFGIGITEQRIEPKSSQSVLDLLAMAPAYNAACIKKLEAYEQEKNIGHSWEKLAVSEILAVLTKNGPCYCKSIAPVLASVISEAEGIIVEATSDDFTCQEYLVFTPQYPWVLVENERNLSQQKLETIFTRYLSIITDMPVRIGEQCWNKA